MVTGKLAQVQREMAEISRLSGVDREYTRDCISSGILISLSSKTPIEIEGKLLGVQTSKLQGKPTTGSVDKDQGIDRIVRLTRMVAEKALDKRLSLQK